MRAAQKQGVYPKRPRYAQAEAEKEEAPETGGSGLLRFLMGGTCDGGGKPHHCNLDNQHKGHFNPRPTGAIGLW